MKAIEKLFGDVYLPKKAFVVYQHNEQESNIYVEAYDMSATGKPINAHPLALEESTALSKALNFSGMGEKDFLTSTSLLPEKVIYINHERGFVLWHTPSQQVDLLFKKSLSIPCGKAFVPALIWKADREKLKLFALKGKRKPEMKTELHDAPFFNVYEDGRVCMGTVDVDMDGIVSLEEFISQWEGYFFGSYFSHMIRNAIRTRRNIVQLWQEQVGTGNPFPEEVLIKSGLTIKDLLK